MICVCNPSPQEVEAGEKEVEAILSYTASACQSVLSRQTTEWAGETVQLLRAVVALAEDQSSVPNTILGGLQLTSMLGSLQLHIIPAPEGQIPFSDLCGHALHIYINSDRHTHNNNKINRRKKTKYPMNK